MGKLSVGYPVGYRLIVWCLAGPAMLVAQPERITGTIDNKQSIAVRGIVHPLAQPGYDQGAVEASFRLGYIQMILSPTAAQRSALDQLLAAQQNPSSPEFHKWLTPEQFADRFGAAPTDFAKIRQWLISAGFSIKYTARGRDYIAFSGTAAQVEAAFHTTVHRYRVKGETHFAVASDPLVPAAFRPLVGAMLGLNDFFLQPLSPITLGTFTANALAPGDVATIYDINPLYQQGINGKGQTIAIVGLTDLYTEDIQMFRAMWGLGAPNIQAVLVGDDPGLNPGALEEAVLDLEWSGAIAPAAAQIFVYGTNPDAAAYYAVDQNLAPILSESLGTCETFEPPGYSFSYELEAQKANAQGITWVVASGDAGPAACDNGGVVAAGGITVSFPASVPEITAVGGTEFNEGAANYWSASVGANGSTALGYVPEMVWNEGIYATGYVALAPFLNMRIGASGGGPSVLYPKPSWQSGPGVPADGQRDLPDISLNASGIHDPYSFLFSGIPQIVGGTSASVQVFAGMLALLNQYTNSAGLGNINEPLYALAVTSPADFHDITAGNSIVPCFVGTPQCTTGQYGYNAAPGYDLATGLGSVDFYNLATSWGNPFPASATISSLSPASVAAGAAAFTLTVNGSNFASAAAVQWNGAALPTTFVSATQLTASVGASLIAQAGTAAITVSSGAAIAGPLYITAVAPSLTVSSPRMTAQPAAIQADGSCAAPPAVTYFAPTMTPYVFFTTTSPDSLFSVIWLAADGEDAGQAASPSVTASGNTSGVYCVSVRGPAIADLPPSLFGNWSVMVYADGGMLFSLQFTVQCSTGVPSITSIESAGAFGGFPYFASGSWLEIKGTELGDPADPRLTASTNPGQWTSNDFNGANAPTSLDGISVSIDGKPGFVSFISPGQINVQAPADAATGNVPVTVTTCRATSATVSFAKQALAPGLLAPASFTIHGTPYMAATFASDGAYVLNTSAGAALGLNSRPAKPGDVIVAYGIGFGAVTPSILPGVIAGQANALTNPVTFSFGSAQFESTNAALAYAGLAGNLVGVYEFYITVPSDLANGDYQINVTQNGTLVPQTMFLTVQN